MKTPLNESLPIADRHGVITRNFHRWLRLLVTESASTPRIFDEAPGTFSIADGQHGLFIKRLTLSGSQRGTMQGSARMVGCG